MFKKIILASAILAATVSVAEAAVPAPYVGASVGIVNNSLNVDSYSIGTYRGVPLNVFIGYGGVLSSNFYLAGEFNATVGTSNITKGNGLKTSYGLGASLIPGFMLNENTLAFGRIGAVSSHFTSIDDERNGGIFGLGLQTSVTQNLDVRGEYDFVAYQSKNEGGLSVAPRQDLFTVGLVYKIS